MLPSAHLCVCVHRHASTLALLEPDLMHANCLYFVVNSCGVTQPAVRKEVAAAIIKAVTSVKSAEITPDKVRVVLQRNVTLHCAGARSVHACFFVRCL